MHAGSGCTRRQHRGRACSSDRPINGLGRPGVTMGVPPASPHPSRPAAPARARPAAPPAARRRRRGSTAARPQCKPRPQTRARRAAPAPPCGRPRRRRQSPSPGPLRWRGGAGGEPVGDGRPWRRGTDPLVHVVPCTRCPLYTLCRAGRGAGKRRRPTNGAVAGSLPCSVACSQTPGRRALDAHTRAYGARR